MRVAKPLTDSRIRGIKPGAKRQRLCDGAGLYLVTAPKSGSRAHQTWEYRFRSPLTGRVSTIKLGDYPATTIAEARAARLDAERIVARGLDPAIEQKRARVLSAAPTLESVARAWDHARAGSVDDLTRKTAMRRLETYVLPTLGSCLLSQVAQADLRRALDVRRERRKGNGAPDLHRVDAGLRMGRSTRRSNDEPGASSANRLCLRSGIVLPRSRLDDERGSRWLMTKLVASALLALVACGGETDNEGSATTVGGDPPSGFYARTITTTADACTPARVKGDRGNVLVSAKADGANIPIPFVEGGPPRQDMPWSGTSLNDFAGCTGSRVDISVAHKSSDSFEVDVTERWEDVSACAGKPAALVLGVPSSSCTATRRFEFTLVKACPATMGGVSCS